MSEWWLVVGPEANWRVAFDQGNIWGVKDSGRPAALWRSIVEGDRLLFYVTSPVAGVVGVGTVRRRFRQDRPLWPDEVTRGEVVWPLRFEFDVEHLLPQELWRTQRVTASGIQGFARGGLQTLPSHVVEEIATQMPEVKSVLANRERASTSRLTHANLIDMLVDAGRLQRYLAEKEYPMENERLDVVWRRVARSVPTFVFEVQVAGDLYHALGKLKHAYDLWNSRIFLVASPADRPAVQRLLSGTFHEMVSIIRLLETENVRELLSIKRSLRNLENDLGLL